MLPLTMTSLRTLQEELSNKVERPVGESRPRCTCHGKYLEVNTKQPHAWKLCPSSASYQAAPVRAEALREPVKVEQVSFTPPGKRWLRCTKTGHATRGKAEAAIRSIQRRTESGSLRPDWKPDQELNVYECKRAECKEKPFHIGHKRDGETVRPSDSNQS